METLKIFEEYIPSGRRDAKELMISADYLDKKFVSFIDITGIRQALVGGDIKPLVEKGKKLFEKDVITKKIKPSDRVKYCFWADGDFIVYPESTDVNIQAKISRYAGGRLHIELKAEYRNFFKEGDKVKITKDNST